MTKYYYTKKNSGTVRKFSRVLGLIIAGIGIISILYVFFPIISWQIYFAPIFAAANVAVPIPKTTLVSQSTINNLISQANPFQGIDYSNAQNWFPTIKAQAPTPKIPSYVLSIPKLHIQNAQVSTIDYDLDIHLVNYGGTAIPANKGTAVVFGHSTLPQLFNPRNYKTIFANAYQLKTGDDIEATVANITYYYKIYNISVVEPTDTSVFAQNFDDSYLTIITCTPPGTTWKRLVIRSRIQPL